MSRWAKVRWNAWRVVCLFRGGHSWKWWGLHQQVCSRCPARRTVAMDEGVYEVGPWQAFWKDVL